MTFMAALSSWPDQACVPAAACAITCSTINLGRAKSAIVFVGYAATGTLARRIIDGAKQVRIFGEEVPVNTRIYTINGFSAHAGQAELLAWQKQTGARRTFLVYGEESSMNQFAAHLGDTRVEMPTPNQSFDL